METKDYLRNKTALERLSSAVCRGFAPECQGCSGLGWWARQTCLMAAESGNSILLIAHSLILSQKIFRNTSVAPELNALI
jgi:hypothetical protein